MRHSDRCCAVLLCCAVRAVLCCAVLPGASESEVKLTLYEQAPAPKGWPDYDGHGSPMPAYATPELWRWLLERRLPAE